MRTVNDVSKLTGVSVRTLHYYDQIGLLPPAAVTDAGYRLYDDAALERLGQILLLRELEFPLKQIVDILSDPAFDRTEAMAQQLTLLTMRRDRLNRLITLAENIKKGEKTMDFKAFDKSEIEKFSAEAKQRWGGTAEYAEYEKKAASTDFDEATKKLMECFAGFGKLVGGDPASSEAAAQAALLQRTITENFYACSKEILSSLGQMYTADERFSANIDSYGGAGTADFAAKAIAAYCKK